MENQTMKLATEFQPVSYTLSCDVCDEVVVLNIELPELLDGNWPDDPHRRKPEGKQGGLWSSSQTAIVRHHQKHSTPEPRCSCRRTLWWHEINNVKLCDMVKK